jgi:hypothetical protein
MLEKYPQALRDLSLALCPALEAMYAAVPEGEAKPLPWIPLAHPDPYEFRMITGAEILANARALRERTAMQNAAALMQVENKILASVDRETVPLRQPNMFDRAIELYDPFLSPPKHVRNRCVRSLEAQAEHAKCTRLLGPAECFECQSSPCRWSAGGWPEPGFAEDMRIIHINPDLDLNGCDALRGSSGVLVRLAGKAADYNRAVLRYLLLDILDPGHIATTYADPEFGRRWEIWKAERVDVEIRNSAEAARRP